MKTNTYQTSEETKKQVKKQISVLASAFDTLGEVFQNEVDSMSDSAESEEASAVLSKLNEASAHLYNALSSLETFVEIAKKRTLTSQ